jgi:hypothetical protein
MSVPDPWSGGLHFLSAGLRRLHSFSDVAWDQSFVSSLFERLAERAVAVQHASRREPGIQLFPLEAAHVIGREGLEPDPAQRRAQMHPDDALIPFIGLLANCISDRVREPAGQILPNTQAAGVECQAALPIRESLRELRRNLLAGLAVERPALAPFRCVHHVLGAPAATLAPPDAGLAVSRACLRLALLYEFGGLYSQGFGQLPDRSRVRPLPAVLYAPDRVVGDTTPLLQLP